MKATNILWDCSEEEAEFLPEEIKIPAEIENEGEDAISDFLSDTTGFCHCGFSLTKN